METNAESLRPSVPLQKAAGSTWPFHPSLKVDPVTDIHPDDHMWNTGQEWYFPVGQSALDIVCRAISLSWLGKVERILDLACGHGRVARYLRAGFPSATLYVCDIDVGAVDFCTSRFAGVGIFSKHELTEVALPTELDVIWVGSLFTHVDIGRTARWLPYLCDHLGRQGVLVATFTGGWDLASKDKEPMFREIRRQYDALGYGFAPYPGGTSWGVAVFSPSSLLSLACTINGVRVAGFMERGWANNQDVLVLTKHDRLLKHGN